MTFGRRPLLLQKYNILPKRRKKTNIVTLKVYERNRERLNMSRYLVFHCTMYLDREEKDIQPISSAFIIAFGC